MKGQAAEKFKKEVLHPEVIKQAPESRRSIKREVLRLIRDELSPVGRERPILSPQP